MIYYTLVLLVLQLAFDVFGSNPISQLITGMIAFLPKIFVANVASIFILGLAIIAALNEVNIATTVTTPVLIAVLAPIAGGDHRRR